MPSGSVLPESSCHFRMIAALTDDVKPCSHSNRQRDVKNKPKETPGLKDVEPAVSDNVTDSNVVPGRKSKSQRM